MSHELKSCPFCGGADVREDHNMRNHFEEIYCDECGAKVSVEGVHSDAVTAWNRRPSPPPPVEVSEAAKEWKSARLSCLEIGVKHAEYMARLNRLSEAEDALSAAIGGQDAD